MANLITKTKKINLIISLANYQMYQVKGCLDSLCSWLDANSEIYGAIIHDRDFTDDGEKKTIHIHAVFMLKTSGVRLSTTLNNICDATLVMPNAITIDKFTSFEGSFQYLVHKNNPEKAQYPVSSIRTNATKEEVSNFLDACTSTFDFEKWRAICRDAGALDDVIGKIGLSYYNMYRNTITDLFRCFHDGELYTRRDSYDELLHRVVPIFDDLRALCSNPKYLDKGCVPLLALQGILKDLESYKYVQKG